MTNPSPDPETITAIAPLEKDPNSRRVHVGDRVVAVLRANDVDAIGLVVGARWSDVLADAVAAALAGEKARKDAMSMLARRGRSRIEVIDRLVKRGHSPEIAEIVVDELVEHGWLDDEAVARETAESILRKGAATAPLLRRRIEARGVHPTIAARVADEAVAGVDPVEAALEVARALPAAAEPPSPAVVRRVAAALARRGFDEDTVSVVVDRLGLARTED